MRLIYRKERFNGIFYQVVQFALSLIVWVNSALSASVYYIGYFDRSYDIPSLLDQRLIGFGTNDS